MPRRNPSWTRSIKGASNTGCIYFGWLVRRSGPGQSLGGQDPEQTGWPCFEQGSGADEVQGALPAKTILWLCEMSRVWIHQTECSKMIHLFWKPFFPTLACCISGVLCLDLFRSASWIKKKKSCLITYWKYGSPAKYIGGSTWRWPSDLISAFYTPL